MPLYGQYNPREVAQSWGGIDLLAPMDGVFISIEYAAEGSELHVGPAGDVTFIINNNESGIIRTTLKAESPSNDLLSARFNAGRRVTLAGYGNYMLKDLNGLTVVEAAISRIQRMPNLEFGDGQRAIEWAFLCAQITAHAGSSVVGF